MNEPTKRETGERPAEREEREEQLTIVGIGASAGGLAALQSFFDALPAENGMAFVVVTHMDPQRESLLPELLQKHTQMAVEQVQDSTRIRANHVYVIPPNRRIRVTDTHLDTESFAEPRGQRTPIDFFFRSLAKAHREAVAVILSGGGTDGAVGIKAVKEGGGLLLAQDPDEAEHDSMPRAAINTGLADVVGGVAHLADKLIAYQRNGIRLPRTPEALSEEELATLYRILTQVQVATGHDFSQYKHSTLLRRIQQRMQLSGHKTMDAYLGHLRHDVGEAYALFNDLLIGVTNFFRDEDSWEALAEQVIPQLFEGKQQGDTIRVWSIGCATGEEAYSLAILLLEQRNRLELPSRPDLQIFASDLDDEALAKAREGVYPQAIEADVSPGRLESFFIKEGHHYRVRTELRDIILFSNHSVLRDPPFSRLDLLSCRNLLIYLDRQLQEDVFQIFHYALRPNAYLFLGSSESVETNHDLFRALDKKHRLYRARPWQRDRPELPRLPLTVQPVDRQRRLGYHHGRERSASAEPGDAAALHLEALEDTAPPSILVDREYQIIHLSASAGRYLQHPGGTITPDLLQLVRSELRSELHTALFQALTQERRVIGRPVLTQFDDTARRVTIVARPYRYHPDHVNQALFPVDQDKWKTRMVPDAGERLALVLFLEDQGLAPETAEPEAPELAQPPAEREALLAQLQTEVQRLREQLQATTEEYESSNEELKAANEELQSINEEYRSTTEELETSKEELQSVNEELQTVNAELKGKLEEISRAHNDMENLMAATGIATLFLDRQLRIQRFTPTTTELFNIIPGDRGRPIGHLTRSLAYDNLEEDAARVLETLIPMEREVRAMPDDPDGPWLLARLRPYRTADDRIEGVVLTFVDINEFKKAETALQRSQARLRMAQEAAGVGTFEWNIQTGVNTWTPELEKLYGLTPGSFEGTYDAWAALVHPEDLPQAEQAVQEALESGRFVAEWRAVRPDGDIVWTLARGWVEMDAQGEPVRMIGANVDISDRKNHEQALAESEARYRALTATLEERVLRRTAELRRSEERLRKLVEASAAAVWTTDAHGQVVEDSPSWRAYTGQTLAEWLEDGWTAAVHPRDRDLAFSNWTQSVESESPLNTECRTYHATSEQWRWTHVRAVPLRNKEGKVRGWIGMHIDIDDRKQAEQAVHQLVADLTLVEQRERDRIAQILHDELQQQLYTVRLQLSLLKDAQASGDEALFAKELAATQELVGQSLATTRQLNVNLSPPILRDEGLAEALVWLAAQMERQHHLVVTIDSEEPIVIADKGLQVLLFQTVRELLFNVVKHAETNHAEVRLRQESDQVIVTVKDDGRGFDAASILADRPSGSGLTTFRHRLTLVGGQLDVESSPANGAQITVSAPLQIDRS